MTNRKSVMQKIAFNKIYNKNCLEGMKSIPKNKIDLIITDPPFAIDFKAKKANYNRKGCLLYTSPSPRDATLSRMPSSA